MPSKRPQTSCVVTFPYLPTNPYLSTSFKVLITWPNFCYENKRLICKFEELRKHTNNNFLEWMQSKPICNSCMFVFASNDRIYTSTSGMIIMGFNNFSPSLARSFVWKRMCCVNNWGLSLIKPVSRLCHDGRSSRVCVSTHTSSVCVCFIVFQSNAALSAKMDDGCELLEAIKFIFDTSKRIKRFAITSK